MNNAWADVEWGELFTFSVPILETIVRGSCVYLAIFLMLRVVLKRESSSVGVADLLVIVMLADAAQNAMAGSYTSIVDGLLLVATIIFWSYMLHLLSFYFKPIRRFLHPPPLMLIHDGQVQRKNMRKELLTMEELLSQMREQGVDSVDQVYRACMEENGHISIVKMEDAPAKKTRKSSKSHK